MKCTHCNGTGQIGYAVDPSDYCPCPICEGQGEIELTAGVKDGPVLFYCKDGILYPVALKTEQHEIFEMTVRLLSPLRIVSDKPQGTAINLIGGRQ